MREYSIGSNEANQRLDKYLKKILPGASMGFVFKMLRKKNITLCGKKATGKEVLSQGDVVKLFLSDDTINKFSQDIQKLSGEFEKLRALDLHGLRIVYEDADILAADKPYNMLSQKAKEHDVSANEYLLGYLIRSGALSLEQYQTFHPSVANRLDRNTTGLLLMGKSLAGSQKLAAMLKERDLKKYYRAVVAGRLERGQLLRGYLKKDETTNQVTITETPQEAASWIETEYEPLHASGETTLVEVHLITGKTHQIRAHLASIGHPVIGDPKYGSRSINQRFIKKYHVKHQLLHAYRLEFPDGREIIAELPQEFDPFE